MFNRAQMIAEGGQVFAADRSEIFSSSNILRTNDALVAVNPGAYLRFCFTGNVLRLGFETSHLKGAAPVVAVTIDGQLTMHSVTPVLTFIMPDDGLHHATLVFDSRGDFKADAWSGVPWPQQAMVLHTVALATGRILGSVPLHPHRLEIDGDSITEGIGTLSPHAGSASNGFALTLAGLLQAEVGLHGWSGNGYAAPGGGIPWEWVADRLWHDQPRRYADDLDMLMVLEGNNDGLSPPEQLRDGVRRGLDRVLASTPSRTQIVIFGPLLSTTQAAGQGGLDVHGLEDAIEAAALSMGSDRVHFFRISHLYDPAATLDGIHPDARLSMTVIAPALAALAKPILQRARLQLSSSMSQYR